MQFLQCFKRIVKIIFEYSVIDHKMFASKNIFIVDNRFNLVAQLFIFLIGSNNFCTFVQCSYNIGEEEHINYRFSRETFIISPDIPQDNVYGFWSFWKKKLYFTNMFE